MLLDIRNRRIVPLDERRRDQRFERMVPIAW